MESGARGSGKNPVSGTGGGLCNMRFSSIDSSDLAGDARDSEAAFVDSATSDRDEVPGLCFIFFEGDGASVGPGVRDDRFNFDLVSSTVTDQYRIPMTDM